MATILIYYFMFMSGALFLALLTFLFVDLTVKGFIRLIRSFT